jgi:enoyl-CoA hydratase/carnithine racemase
MTEYQHLRVRHADGICEVLLDRPDKRNALGIGPGSNREELLAAMMAADDDDEVGSILLRANGPSFCAGGDLTGSPATETALDEHVFGQSLVRFYTGLRGIRKPIVAAVHGHCLGAGLGLIAQCDFVVAASDARFGLIEGRIGHPGATEIVPLIGLAWAKFLLLTGELIDAEVAERIGLILTSFPAKDLEERSRELARRLARMPRAATVLNKAGINQMGESMGFGAARLVGRAYDTLTKGMSAHAEAPDGRRFSEILSEGGIAALKQARDTQYQGDWLPKRPSR